MKHHHILPTALAGRFIGRRLAACTLALLGALAACNAGAQSFGVCDARLFLSQAPANRTTLYNVNTGTNPFTYTVIGQTLESYNGTGFNPADNYIYAISQPNDTLLRIDVNGATTDLGVIAGLPVTGYNAGSFDNVGTYYVKAAGSGNSLYAIDVVTRISRRIALSMTISVSDLAWSNGAMYGYSDQGNLYRIDVVTGSTTLVGTGQPLFMGAMFGTPTSLYGADNTGDGFFQIDVATGATTRISNAPASGNNDGVHCPNAELAFAANLSITKTNTPAQGPVDLTDDLYDRGQARTYQIVIVNPGPFGTQNATVSDPVPPGIDPSTVSWTCVASGEAVCGAPSGTGALNDTRLSLPVGGSAIYRYTMTVPLGFRGPLRNEATITPGLSTGDPDPSNNVAVDSDIIPAATITLVKDASPDDPQDFTFNTVGLTPASLALDDDADPALSNTHAFESLEAGSYTISEGSTANWLLTGLVCVDPDGGSSVNLATGTATLDADSGEDIVCTYTNTLQQTDLEIVKANIDPMLVGQIARYQLTLINHGPLPANGAVLRDVAGAGLDCLSPSATAACTATGGAACPAATVPTSQLLGAGVSIPTLPVNGQVTVTLQCRVTP